MNRRQFCMNVAAASAALALPRLTPAADEQGWVSLLEGNDFSNHWTTTGNWKMEDGVVRLEPRPGEKGWTRYDAYLWSKKQYKDFQIQFDYKVAKAGNSGFYFRVGSLKDPVTHGIEVQIYDSHGQTKLTDHTSGGVIPRIVPSKNAARPAGEWNTFDITSKRGVLVVKLNGEEVNVVKLTEGELAKRPETGYIGFQDHGLPLWLRKIRIREL